MFNLFAKRRRGTQTATILVHDANGNLKQRVCTKNARVDTGAQSMVDQMFGAQGTPAFNFVAFSTSTTAIVKTLTASTFTSGGEITAGGLARKQTTYGSYAAPASLNANATATLTATWTATAGGTIGSVAALSAVSGGVLGLATVLGSAVTYAATDVISLVWSLAQ